VNPLRSVGARLSLALLLVVAGALAIVYVALVPSLERNLVDAKLAQIERSARSLGQQIPREPFAWHDFLENAAGSTNAQLVLLDVYVPPPTPALRVVDNSSNVKPQGLGADPVAIEAAMTGEPAHGTVERSDTRSAEAAVPLSTSGPILLVKAPLSDTLRNVDLVRRRILIAGGLALLVSLLVGYGASWAFARRIRRLEHAAERIATGHFDEPVVDPGRDELGELAQAFDRMRLRLAQLDHARREFIANASHELRTPLFSLGGFIELLTDEELDEPTRREFLETMRGQVERLTKLATDLLDLTRLDAGRLQVAHERLDLGSIAESLLAEFEPVARAREHALDLSADGDAPVLADEQRVLQIGRILLENALVHTPAGTAVRVEVGARDGHSELIVVDEGPGIPDEHAGQVFERFYRVDGTRASGSGLGLAIARELATLMGGEIRLESGPGETRFTLVLPTAEAVKQAGPVA
jgi:signal transduction histidine kinase